MSDELKVKVCRWGQNRPLALRWRDPVSGLRRAKSAGTNDAKKAERRAGELEKQLRAGVALCPGRITWQEFRSRYEAEKLSALSERTFDAATSAMNHVARVLNPGKLAALTSATMSKFQAALRKEGMKSSTLASHLRHLKAMFSWGVSMELMSAAPKVEMPHKAKGQKVMRGRPIVGEEFERMLSATPKVLLKAIRGGKGKRRLTKEQASTFRAAVRDWRGYLRGLWLSGLRLEESTVVSWEPHALISVDLMGGRPVLRFRGEGQKNGRAEIVPVTPDFGEFLLATPEGERHGPVFPLDGLRTGRRMTSKTVGRMVARIGGRAGVIVNATTRRDKKTGEAAEVTEFASAHDLRRSFGTRWARRVRAIVLKKLMRHASIETTLRYYVDLDAGELAKELWAGAGNTSGNTAHFGAGNKAGAPADAATETPEAERLYASGGQGSRTLNPLRGT